MRQQSFCLRNAIFALLLGLWLALLPQTASAEKTDWKDKTYDFSRVRRVLIYDVDLSAANLDSEIKIRKFSGNYPEYAKKLGCEIVTEEQARRQISLAIGVDLDTLAKSDPAKAQELFTENLPKVADAYIKGRVLKWENTYYIQPERTVWEQKRIDTSYRDRDGRWINDYYYITVPVTYPPRRIDVSTLNMSFEAYDARTGKLFFGREDDRDREDYDAQDGMYERICKSFFGDLGSKLH